MGKDERASLVRIGVLAERLEGSLTVLMELRTRLLNNGNGEVLGVGSGITLTFSDSLLVIRTVLETRDNNVNGALLGHDELTAMVQGKRREKFLVIMIVRGWHDDNICKALYTECA